MIKQCSECPSPIGPDRGSRALTCSPECSDARKLRVNREHSVGYRERNKEKIAHRKRQDFLNNREAHYERSKKWRKENIEQVRAAARAYQRRKRAEDPEGEKAKQRAWCKKNPEKACAKVKRWAAKNKEKIAARKKQWRKDNPEKVRKLKKLRYEREGGTGSRKKWKLLRRLDGDCCAWCGKDIDFSDETSFQVDHWHPVARGGTSELDNLCLMHRHCNSTKRAKWPLPPLNRKRTHPQLNLFEEAA